MIYMPHLSPMMWMLTFPLLWFIFLMLFSTMWWHQPPQLNSPSDQTNTNLNNKMWSWK